MTEFHSMYLRQKCLILLLSRLKNLLLSLGVEFLYDDFDFLTEVAGPHSLLLWGRCSCSFLCIYDYYLLLVVCCEICSISAYLYI